MGGETRELFEQPETFIGGGATEYDVKASAYRTVHPHVYECARPIPAVSFSIVQLRQSQPQGARHVTERR